MKQSVSPDNRPRLLPVFNEVSGRITFEILSAIRRSPIEHCETGVRRFFVNERIQRYPYATVKVYGEPALTARFDSEDDAEHFMAHAKQLHCIEHPPISTIKEAA